MAETPVKIEPAASEDFPVDRSGIACRVQLIAPKASSDWIDVTTRVVQISASESVGEDDQVSLSLAVSDKAEFDKPHLLRHAYGIVELFDGRKWWGYGTLKVTGVRRSYSPIMRVDLTLRPVAWNLQAGIPKARYQGYNLTDSEAVTQIADVLGLAVRVSPTSVKRSHIIQGHETYALFLNRLAARNGYDWYIQDKTLVFEPLQGRGTVLPFAFAEILSTSLTWEDLRPLMSGSYPIIDPTSSVEESSSGGGNVTVSGVDDRTGDFGAGDEKTGGRAPNFGGSVGLVHRVGDTELTVSEVPGTATVNFQAMTSDSPLFDGADPNPTAYRAEDDAFVGAPEDVRRVASENDTALPEGAEATDVTDVAGGLSSPSSPADAVVRSRAASRSTSLSRSLQFRCYGSQEIYLRAVAAVSGLSNEDNGRWIITGISTDYTRSGLVMSLTCHRTLWEALKNRGSGSGGGSEAPITLPTEPTTDPATKAKEAEPAQPVLRHVPGQTQIHATPVPPSPAPIRSPPLQSSVLDDASWE